MDKSILLNNFEKEINPVLANLLASKVELEKLPDIQNKISNINKKYPQLKAEKQFYKIYYAQALIDYLGYKDDLAKDSLMSAKEMYGGEFDGYHRLLANLNPVPEKPRNSKAIEILSWAIITFSSLSLFGGLFLSDPLESMSTKIGGLVFGLLLLAFGIFLNLGFKK